ncbi:hypothetical protein GF362_01990 [Candidatus Dojkabacteria bacterium]|nr:hypothetical protein [Candidatus Dojkabacteria bacterium]
MPLGNRMGPFGEGPMTGLGLGDCPTIYDDESPLLSRLQTYRRFRTQYEDDEDDKEAYVRDLEIELALRDALTDLIGGLGIGYGSGYGMRRRDFRYGRRPWHYARRYYNP